MSTTDTCRVDMYENMYKCYVWLYPAWRVVGWTVGANVGNMLYIGRKSYLHLLLFLFICNRIIHPPCNWLLTQETEMILFREKSMRRTKNLSNVTKALKKTLHCRRHWSIKGWFRLMCIHTPETTFFCSRFDDRNRKPNLQKKKTKNKSTKSCKAQTKKQRI